MIDIKLGALRQLINVFPQNSERFYFILCLKFKEKEGKKDIIQFVFLDNHQGLIIIPKVNHKSHHKPDVFSWSYIWPVTKNSRIFHCICN